MEVEERSESDRSKYLSLGVDSVRSRPIDIRKNQKNSSNNSAISSRQLMFE